jgi:YD repeat-containing protein
MGRIALAERRRRYVRDFPGRAGGRARYIKEVDADEETTRFAQEIYDAAGRLIAVHEKFPVDLGHKQM